MGGRKPKVISAEEETPKTQKAEEGKKEPEKKVKKSFSTRQKKIRGKKHQEAKKKIEPRAYPVAEAATKAGADQIGDDAVIESIAQGKLPAADAVVATPAFMPKLARIARFLGPKGLMPRSEE